MVPCKDGYRQYYHFLALTWPVEKVQNIFEKDWEKMKKDFEIPDSISQKHVSEELQELQGL